MEYLDKVKAQLKKMLQDQGRMDIVMDQCVKIELNKKA